MNLRLLVCGGRTYTDRPRIQSVLDRIVSGHGVPELVISGGATGADTEALVWARSRGYPRKVYSADWSTYGRAAGALRNQHMLDVGRPTLVVAFPGGPGTADMIRRSKAAGILTEVVPAATI